MLIGGQGERKTLRLVARYGDACNLFAGDPGVIAHKIDVLRRHCDDVGRDESTIAKTIIGGTVDPHTDPDGWLASMEPYAALGVSQVWVGPDAADPVGSVERLTEAVLPRLAQLGA